MSTRLRRPSLWRQLALTAALVAFQGYLGWSAIGGNFGIESQKVMQADIANLKAKSAGLEAETESFRHKVSLFDPKSLDPDILSEKARALLSMAQSGDMIVMVDPKSGQPIGGLTTPSTDIKAMPKIESGID